MVLSYSTCSSLPFPADKLKAAGLVSLARRELQVVACVADYTGVLLLSGHRGTQSVLIWEV